MKTLIRILLAVIVLASCQDRMEEDTIKITPTVILGENESIEKVFSNASDTTIQLNQGTKILIEEEAFVDMEGNPIKGEIQLKAKEVIKPADIIRENISTVSEEGILETRGMINIEAFSQGAKVKLKEGKKITLLLPNRDSIPKDVDLYMGVENEQGIIEWVKADISAQVQETVKKTVKDINIRYRIVEDLDSKNTELKNNSKGEKIIDSLVTFSTKEIEDLLNKNIRIHWLLFDDGDLDIFEIEGNISEVKKKEITRKLNSIPFIKPFKREGKVYDMQGVIDISFYEIDEAKFSNQFYAFTATKLGWLNCDIFIQLDVPKINMEVKAKENIVVKVMFENYDTYVSGYWNDTTKKYLFPNLPKGQPIKILALDSNEENETAMYSITEGKVKEGEVSLVPLKEISLDKLNEIIDKM